MERLPVVLLARQPPTHKPLSKQAWLEHFRKVQLATEATEPSQAPSGLNCGQLPGSFQPLFSGDAGRQALAAAASSMPRGKATPHRALPAKIWSLFLKGHGKSQPGPTFRNAQMLHPMDIASSTCWMQLVKCSTKRPSNFSLILCYHTNTGMRPTDRAGMPSCN